MRRKYIFVLLAAALIMVLAGCNNPPNIPRIITSSTSVESGDVVILSAADVSDPDNELEELTLLWEATGGEFDFETGINVNWTAPEVEADEIFTITLIVEDPEGETNSQTVDITVAPDTTPEPTFEVIVGSKESPLTFPFNGGGYDRSQFLYFPEDIDTSGKIIRLALMPAGDTVQTFKNVKIKIVPVEADSLVDSLDQNVSEEMTKYLVYQEGTLDYGAKDEWFVFNFVSPFEYDGESNFILQFEYDMRGEEVEFDVETYAFGLGSGPNRHVGIVRSDDENGTASQGALYLKLIFEKPQE